MIAVTGILDSSDCGRLVFIVLASGILDDIHLVTGLSRHLGKWYRRYRLDINLHPCQIIDVITSLDIAHRVLLAVMRDDNHRVHADEQLIIGDTLPVF